MKEMHEWSALCPKHKITLMGMERIVPTWDDLEVMATMLPRSATGQRLTVYMLGITGPRRPDDGDGPEEMHVIILDNGRSLQLGDPEFQELLHCIRCGACLNACPRIPAYWRPFVRKYVQRAVGRCSSQRSTKMCWSGIMSPMHRAFAASYEACPVKIPLHDMLVCCVAAKMRQERACVPKNG